MAKLTITVEIDGTPSAEATQEIEVSLPPEEVSPFAEKLAVRARNIALSEVGGRVH